MGKTVLMHEKNCLKRNLKYKKFVNISTTAELQLWNASLEIYLFMVKKKWWAISKVLTHQEITCSKILIETQEQDVKYLQS